MQILIIIALVLIAAAVVFAVQNVAAVAVTLFFWKVPSSLALVLLIALVAGVLIGLLLVLPGSIKNRMAVSNQKKKLAALDERLATNPSEASLVFLSSYLHHTVGETAAAKLQADVLKKLAGSDKLMTSYADFVLTGKLPVSEQKK